MGRAEEVQAQHLPWAPGDRGDGVDIQRRGITGEDRPRLEQAIEFAEDLLLQLEVLVDRLDHQIHIADRRIVRRRAYPGPARIGLCLIDPPLTHVVCISLGHRCQRLFEHLRIVVHPLHRDPGIGQAHHDPAAHGPGTDHRGALNIDLAHSGSPVGGSKTQTTIIRRRAFLKFIPVMGGIQQMDRAGINPGGDVRPNRALRRRDNPRAPRNPGSTAP